MARLYVMQPGDRIMRGPAAFKDGRVVYDNYCETADGKTYGPGKFVSADRAKAAKPKRKRKKAKGK